MLVSTFIAAVYGDRFPAFRPNHPFNNGCKVLLLTAANFFHKYGME
ncbi:MAG: hypothetical protein N2235_09315 [Fischerella sp.]|nr:hypothetical protein [Fischerella sp.]